MEYMGIFFYISVEIHLVGYLIKQVARISR
jgi:hypothetical protein